jgi:hypothetical protein
MMNEKKHSTLEIIIAICAVITCIAAVLVVPEFRRLIGLAQSNTPVIPTSTTAQVQEPINPPSINTQSIVPEPTIPAVSTQAPVLIHNETVSAESLARIVGGNTAYWKQAGAVVWVYSNKDHNTTMRHPGENMVLTYWAGFGDPKNAIDCQVIISPVNSLEKAVKCPSGTNAQLVADQVGLHLVDHTGFFP